MDKFKQQIQQRLVANIIVDKCAHSEHLIFRDAWCTQERIIRFTTPFFRKLFSYEENENGAWKTGDCVMYEVHNNGTSLVADCVLSISSLSSSAMPAKNDLLKILDTQKRPNSPDVTLHSWKLQSDDGDVNKLLDAFDYLIEKDIPYWEQSVQRKLDASKAEPMVLTEGAVKNVTLNKYERNPKARAECLAAHGTACVVCGIDFAKAYGPEFAGTLEVHHIVPISEIGEEYVVDPVKDLVPVCPNCHTALHSKKDGVYTPEELIEMRSKQSLGES